MGPTLVGESHARRWGSLGAPGLGRAAFQAGTGPRTHTGPQPFPGKPAPFLNAQNRNETQNRTPWRAGLAVAAGTHVEQPAQPPTPPHPCVSRAFSRSWWKQGGTGGWPLSGAHEMPVHRTRSAFDACQGSRCLPGLCAPTQPPRHPFKAVVSSGPPLAKRSTPIPTRKA